MLGDLDSLLLSPVTEPHIHSGPPLHRHCTRPLSTTAVEKEGNALPDRGKLTFFRALIELRVRD